MHGVRRVSVWKAESRSHLWYDLPSKGRAEKEKARDGRRRARQETARLARLAHSLLESVDSGD